MIRLWLRFLTFRLDRDGFAELSWRQYLGPALIATWLVGMGRYWDHPQAHWLQKPGLGSVIYVFVLGAILWLVVTPLKPKRWGYLDVVTVVSLTSPPAILYALPVERWMSVEAASDVNAWFLAAVAAWRVALLVFCLRRLAELTWPRTIVCTLLPLSAIVATLTALNVEHAVFQVMAGIQEPTPNDGSYLVLVLLTVLSAYAALVLIPAYLYLVFKVRWLDPRRERRLLESAIAIAVCLCLGYDTDAQTDTPKETRMTTTASGSFEVELAPQTPDEGAEGSAVGRMRIDKQFHGDLEAVSNGQMLAFRSAVEGSAGYVAIEEVSGTLHGRRGTFVLQHSGTMTRGEPGLSVTVVPDSGTDELEGLSGSMSIDIRDGGHFYEFEYSLDDAP